MTNSSYLASSVGSRICHDIISPLGAIGNGLELLSMGAAADGPEVDLIAQSVTSASARLRAYRVAFGLSQHVTDLARDEVHDILQDLYAGGRFSFVWHGKRNLARSDAKSAFLGLLCLETALPRGGQLELDTREAVTLRGTGALATREAACWDVLSGGGPAVIEKDDVDHADPGEGDATTFEPSRIHFPMLAEHLKITGRPPREAWAPDQLMLTL